MTPFDFVALKAQVNLIQSTLEKNNNNMSKTAASLLIDRKTLYNKIKAYEKYTRATEASTSS